MANVKITQLSHIATLAPADVYVIDDVSELRTYKVTLANVTSYIAANVQTSIDNVSSNVSALQTNINTVSSNVSSLDTRLTSDLGNVVTTVNTVSSNVSSLDMRLSANINTVSGNVSSLDTRLTADLGNVVTTVNTVSSNVSSLDTRLTANINTVSSNVSSLDTRLSANINTVSSNVSSLDTRLSANINTVSSNVSSLDTRLSANINTVSSNVSSLDTRLSANINTVSGNISILSNVIIVQGSNVGLGTSSPEAKLHIDNGAIKITKAPYNALMINAASGSSTAQINLIAGNNQSSIFERDWYTTTISHYGYTPYVTRVLEYEEDASNSLNSGIYFSANSSTRMTIKGTGFVGIGTTNPTQKLDVAGSIKVSGGISANSSFGTSGQILTSDGSIAYWATNPVDTIQNNVNIVSANVSSLDTRLTANINTVSSNVSSLDTRLTANINTVSANVSSLDTRLSANINTVSSNVSSLDTRLSANINTVSSNVSSLDTRLSANINTVSGNVTALAANAYIGPAVGAIWENSTTINTSYSITSGKNAMTAGPITIASNVTITIPTGSVWTII